VPRAGLTTDNAVAAAAGLTGGTGSGDLTVGLIARRLGIRPPGITALPGSGHDPQPRAAGAPRASDRGVPGPEPRRCLNE
jgi:hypothetical protein